MTQLTVDILGLNQGTVKGSDEYPAVDVFDITQSTIGSTKKYLLADLFNFILTSQGFKTSQPVEAASTAPYVATYNNGIGGINATLTDASGTFAPFTIDGITGVVSSLTVPHFYLIKNQVDQRQNGIYELTQQGDGISVPWILIRAFNFNSPLNIFDGEVTMVTGGLTLDNTVWQLQVTPPVIVGTSLLVWVPFQVLSSFVTLPLSPVFGGTGIANLACATITVGGPLDIITGAPCDLTTFNMVGPTNVTFPTSGTLLSTSSYPAPGAPIGSIIISDGINWISSTSLWPNTVGAIGKIIRSNGVNNLYSTATFADTYGASQILFSSGANNVVGLITANLGVLATNASGVPSINTTLLPFIVGPGGFYTTIQSAINAAALTATSSSPKVVLINSGTYVENLTLKSFVILSSFGGVSENSAIIEGNAIYNPLNDNESFTASGVTFKTPGGGGSAFAINGVKICTVDMNDCVFNGTTGTAIECTNPNASLTKSSCHLFASAGQKISNYTGGTIVATSGFATATDTASTVSGATNLVLTNYFSNNAYAISGTSQLSAVNSTFISPTNLTFIDIGAGSTGIIFSCTIVCNSASGFWATGTGNIALNSITTLNGAATGINIGTLNYQAEPLSVGNLSFDGGNSFISTNGQLIIGNTGGNPVINTLTAGAGIGISNGPGTITISGTSGSINPGLINEIAYYAAPGTTLSPITPTQNDGVLVTNNTGVPSILAGPGATGKLLYSNAALPPAWTVPTYPIVSGASGKIIISDGTNNIYSTPTYPNASVTAGKIIISDGTDYIASTSIWPNTVGTVGKIIRSDGTSNVYTTSTFADTYTIDSILYASAANTIQGLASLARSALTTNSTGVPTWIALTDGQIVIGSTAGSPLAATLTAGPGISIANASNSITISGTGAGIGWTEVLGVSQAIVPDSGYVANNAGLVTFTLPVTAAFGSAINIIGKGVGGWKIAQNAGQNLQIGATSSTVGVGGSVASTNRSDSLQLICTTADTTWTVLSAPQGNLTIV